jgi:hypothetical protein
MTRTATLGGALPSTAASCRDPADKTPPRGDRLYQGEGSQSAKTPCLPVSLPANWRELLEGLGYRVKGRRATCPLCGKDGLAVSVLRKGVYCHRSRAHFRSWAELAAAAPGQPRAAGARSSRVRAVGIQPGDREQIQRILAREAAAYEWVTARAAPAEHPYLARKRIPPFGARVDARGNLLVPVYGLSRMGMELLISLERITPDGQKRFEPGCRVKAGYCFLRPDWEAAGRAVQLGPIPEPHPVRVWVCEGFATAATVVMATAEAACCVFFAGNLEAALEALIPEMPGTEFIIAADNDRKTPGNPGVRYAAAAAERFGLRVVWPEFPPGAEGSDWNDLAGLEAEVLHGDTSDKPQGSVCDETQRHD